MHISHSGARRTVNVWYVWCCCFVLPFSAKPGNINGGRSVDTPTRAALLILLHSPLCTNHAAQQPGGRQALSSASGELERGSSESPWPGSLQPELPFSWREPSSTQSWSLDSFALKRMVQPRGIQCRSTAAGGHVCGCNTLLSLVNL